MNLWTALDWVARRLAGGSVIGLLGRVWVVALVSLQMQGLNRLDGRCYCVNKLAEINDLKRWPLPITSLD